MNASPEDTSLIAFLCSEFECTEVTPEYELEVKLQTIGQPGKPHRILPPEQYEVFCLKFPGAIPFEILMHHTRAFHERMGYEIAFSLSCESGFILQMMFEGTIQFSVAIIDTSCPNRTFIISTV
jgi:hypothetical protein